MLALKSVRFGQSNNKEHKFIRPTPAIYGYHYNYHSYLRS